LRNNTSERQFNKRINSLRNNRKLDQTKHQRDSSTEDQRTNTESSSSLRHRINESIKNEMRNQKTAIKNLEAENEEK